MVMTEETQKELTILDERLFRSRNGFHKQPGAKNLRLDIDSYIICFTGRRGAGKTTYMTFEIVKAIAKYNMKVISNFPINFKLRRYRSDGKSYLQEVSAEPLDFEKLILFDEEYKNVLIVIDEAPDIISHLASQTWRNRLMAAFTRQIRKNRNSLFLAAQDFNWIDKSMRWQVDVIVKCQDACRKLGDSTGLDRGEMLFVEWFDNSGQWTGMDTNDRFNYELLPYVCRKKVFPRVLWGDKDHEPVFNSWYQLDVLDSLRKVDLRLTPMQIGDKGDGLNPAILQQALYLIEEVFKVADGDGITLDQVKFYKSFSGISFRDKDALGKLLSAYNADVGKRSSNGRRQFILDNFDLNGFKQHVQTMGVQE